MYSLTSNTHFLKKNMSKVESSTTENINYVIPIEIHMQKLSSDMALDLKNFPNIFHKFSFISTSCSSLVKNLLSLMRRKNTFGKISSILNRTVHDDWMLLPRCFLFVNAYRHRMTICIWTWNYICIHVVKFFAILSITSILWFINKKNAQKTMSNVDWQ